AVEVLRLQLKQVAAQHRADPGIVDEAVDAPESFQCRLDKWLMAVQIGNVAAAIGQSATQPFHAVLQILRRFCREVGNHDVEAGLSERFSAGETDAWRSARDDGERAGHDRSSVRRM